MLVWYIQLHKIHFFNIIQFYFIRGQKNLLKIWEPKTNITESHPASWVGTQKTLILVNIYLFKVNNRNTRKRCQICLKLIINTRPTSLTLLLTLNKKCWLGYHSLFDLISVLLYQLPFIQMLSLFNPANQLLSILPSRETTLTCCLENRIM